MKILYVTSIDISLPKGPSVNEREFSLALAKHFGTEVTLLLRAPRYAVESEIASRARFFGFSKLNAATLPLSELDCYRKGAQLLSEQHFDVLACRMNLFPLGLFLLTQGSHPPLYVKHLVGDQKAFVNVQQGAKYLKGLVLAPIHVLLYRAIARRAAAADVTTAHHRESVRRHLQVPAERLHSIPNATNTDRFQPRDTAAARKALGLDCFESIIGYVGARPWERGAAELIRIAPRLLARHPRAGFLVVGGGEKLDELVAQAKAAGVADAFVFTGEVKYDEVPRHINALDVGIDFDLPARAAKLGGSHQKTRQYIASGVPVVHSCAGEDFIEEFGLGTRVDNTDDEAILQALSHWLTREPAEQAAHMERAHEYAVAHLSSQAMLDARIAIWRSML